MAPDTQTPVVSRSCSSINDWATISPTSLYSCGTISFPSYSRPTTPTVTKGIELRTWLNSGWSDRSPASAVKNQ